MCPLSKLEFYSSYFCSTWVQNAQKVLEFIYHMHPQYRNVVCTALKTWVQCFLFCSTWVIFSSFLVLFNLSSKSAESNRIFFCPGGVRASLHHRQVLQGRGGPPRPPLFGSPLPHLPDPAGASLAPQSAPCVRLHQEGPHQLYR